MKGNLEDLHVEGHRDEKTPYEELKFEEDEALQNSNKESQGFIGGPHGSRHDAQQEVTTAIRGLAGIMHQTEKAKTDLIALIQGAHSLQGSSKPLPAGLLYRVYGYQLLSEKEPDLALQTAQSLSDSDPLKKRVEENLIFAP